MSRKLAIGASFFFFLPLTAAFWLPNTLHAHSSFWFYTAIFSGISALLVTSYLFNISKRVKIKLRFSDVFLSLFLVYAALQHIFQAGFKSNFYLTQWLFLFSCYVMWRVVFEWGIQKGKKAILNIVVIIFLAVGCVETLFGFGQLYGFFPSNNGYFIVTGHFVNPDHFAGFIGSFAPLALGVFLFREKIGNKTLSNVGLATFVLIVAILPATTIRGSWLAVLAGIGFLLYHKYNVGANIETALNTRPKKALATVLVLGITFTAGYALYNLKPDSAFGRLLIWKTTGTMIAEKPLLGHGFDQFKIEYNKAQAQYFASGQASEKEKMIAGNVEHTHNEFLQIWAESGLIGLLLFAGLLWSVFFSYTKRENHSEKSDPVSGYKYALLLSAKASLIAIMVSALFAFPLHIFPTLINLFFLLALAATFINNQPIAVLSFSSVRVKIAGTVLILFFASLGWFSFKKYNVYQQWEEANRLMSLHQYEAAISGFEKLYPELRYEGEFLFRFGGALTASGEYDKAIPILERATTFYSNPNLYMVLAEAYEETETYDKALANYRFSWNIIPHKMYPLYRMAKVHQKTGNQTALLGLAKEIVAKEEKVPTTAGRQIKNEMNDIIQSKDSK